MLCGLGLLAAVTVPQATAITISEFSPIVHESGGMVRAPDGAVWVATDTGLTRMAPDGTVTGTYTSPAPSNLTLGPDGALWFSALASTGDGAALGRMTTAGVYTEHPIAERNAAIGGIVAGADGNLWFSQSLGPTHRIVRMKLSSGTMTEFPGPTVAPGAMAWGPDGNVWFAEGAGHIGRVTPAGAVTEMPVQGTATRLAFAPGLPTGFYVAAGQAGRITPASGLGMATSAVFSQGLAPNADNQDIALGADGNGWFTETLNGKIARVKPSGQIDEFTTGIALRGMPHAIIAGPGTTLWFSDIFNGRIGRIVLDPPQALTGEAGGLTPSTATLSAAILPRGAPTTAHFELGRTTAYGTMTVAQDVGNEDASTLVSAPVTGLEPGTTYHYRIVAKSAIGTAVGTDRTLTTAPLPPVVLYPPPPTPAPDTDSDGYPDAVDCGPLDVTTHPGATEMPGNAADEDCANGPQPYERFFPRVDVTFANHGRRFSVFTRMVISDVPAGAWLRLSCRGRGCTFSTWSSGTVRRATKRLDLFKHLKKSRLRPRAVLELRLMRSDQIGTVVRWTVGPPPRPVVTCLYPGQRKVQKCPR
jgi:virginiamycin B lyase